MPIYNPMIKNTIILAVLGALGWLAYKSTNKADRGITDGNQLTDFSGFTLGNINDTLQGEFMKVSNITGSNVNGRLTPSLQILGFLKGFEQFRLMPYFATASERARGIKTVGYGHVILPLESFSAGISQADASQLFANDVSIASEAVINLVKVPLTQGQFDALTSLVFNIGQGAFRGSTLLAKLNAGDYDGAANQFMAWVKQRDSNGVFQVVDGLYKRRAAELQIFKFSNYVTSFGA